MSVGLGETSRPHPNPSPEGEGLALANPARGEASVRVAGTLLVLRPSFTALVAAEQELGPLFALVERAAEGRLGLGEMVALFWHCLKERPEGLTREAFGEGVTAGGLAGATPALRVLIGQILAGR
ncbi:MAG: gene transfer agent family protein [Sphingomonas sp.]|uniref:gene transfer agent family protein n=1 Tax=Sphingomonas sp. TaxID=28214 RepID=UPI00260D3329|nr:gene transfer agent family protein [Sphingomonas sp.]MDK2766131.1 gene transfer agent family protein [Sphingomonas sp.]